MPCKAAAFRNYGNSPAKIFHRIWRRVPDNQDRTIRKMGCVLVIFIDKNRTAANAARRDIPAKKDGLQMPKSRDRLLRAMLKAGGQPIRDPADIDNDAQAEGPFQQFQAPVHPSSLGHCADPAALPPARAEPCCRVV